MLGVCVPLNLENKDITIFEVNDDLDHEVYEVISTKNEFIAKHHVDTNGG